MVDWAIKLYKVYFPLQSVPPLFEKRILLDVVLLSWTAITVFKISTFVFLVTTFTLKAVSSTQFQSLSVTSLYFISTPWFIKSFLTEGPQVRFLVLTLLGCVLDQVVIEEDVFTYMVRVQNMTQGIFKALFWTQTVSDLYLCSKHRLIWCTFVCVCVCVHLSPLHSQDFCHAPRLSRTIWQW